MTNSSHNKPISTLGTAWQRSLRACAFYRSTIVSWLTKPLARLRRDLRRKSRHAWRKLEIHPVYEQLEPRLVPSTATITTLIAGDLRDATGERARDYTVRVSSETGAMRDGGIVELYDAAQNDALVGRSTLTDGVAQFHGIYGHDRLYAVYLGDQRADLTPSQSATVANPDSPKQPPLPLRFEENQGQTDPSVQFTSRGGGYDLFLTKSEAVFVLPTTNAGPRQGPAVDVLAPTPPDVVRMQLVGANPNVAVRGSSILLTRSNYFRGDDPADWHVDIPNYAKVTYDDVYPGIDLVYYGSDTERRLEFDFVVAPGADPGVIRLQLAGAESVNLDAYGNLIITTPSQLTLVEKAPVIYQDRADGRHAVFGRYTLEQDGIGFHLGSYDASLPLVVDPIWVFGTYLGSTGSDRGNAVAVDGAGNIYLAGHTNTNAFPAVGGYSGSFGGDSDAFVAKFNPAGDTLLFSNYLGGSGHDEAFGVAVSPAGNVFVAGRSESPDLPLANPYQSTNAGGYDAFTAKFDPTGSLLLYSTYLGGSNDDSANAVAVGADDKAVVVGDTLSTNLPLQTAAHTNFGSGSAAFVSKLSADGSTLAFSTFYGGSGNDVATSVAINLDGVIAIGGNSTSTSLPGTMGFQSTSRGNQEGFIATVSSIGQILKSSFFGGDDDDTINSVAFDRESNLYAAGSTTSSNLTILPTSAFQTAPAYAVDAFVSKASPDMSSLLMSTYYGGDGDDEFNAVAVGPSGKISLAGSTTSTDLVLASPLQSAIAGNKDAIYTQLSSDGTSLLYSTYEGTTGNDEANGIAVDFEDAAILVGFSVAAGFPTKNAYQSGFGGVSDVILSKFGPPPPPVITSISSDTGASATDFITTSTSYTLSGTAEPSSTVTIMLAGVGVIATTSANGSGLWSYAVGPFSAGVNTFTVTATLGGVASAPSKPFKVTTDTEDPTINLIVPSSTDDTHFKVIVTALDNVGISASALVYLDVDLNNDNDGYADANETNYQTAVLTRTNGSTDLTGSFAEFVIYNSLITAGTTIKTRVRLYDLAGNDGVSAEKTVIVNSATSTTYTDMTPKGSGLPTYQDRVEHAVVREGVDYGRIEHAVVRDGDPVAQIQHAVVWHRQNQFGELPTLVSLDLDNSPGYAPCCTPSLVKYSKLQPVVKASINTANNTSLPASFSAQLTWNGGSPQTAQVYNTTGYHPGQSLVIAQQVSAANPVTTTGRYNYQLSITPAGGAAYNLPLGTMYVVADDASVLGDGGWSLSNVDRLIPLSVNGSDPAGLMRVHGAGGSSFYPVSGGGYSAPAGDFGTMASAGSGYTYTLPTGEVWTFDSNGLQTKLASADGKALTTFTYTGSRLWTIAAADGAVSTFTYSSNKLSTITTGSRTVTITFTSNDITGITDPTGATRSFTYSSGRIVSDAWGPATTTFSYSTTGALYQWSNGSGSEQSTFGLNSANMQGMNSAFATGPIWASQDGGNNAYHYQRMDTSGRVLEEIASDGGDWNYSLDPTTGLATVVTDPLGRKTTYAYDAAGAVTSITLPDGNSQSFAYQSGAGHHSLTTFTDERGKVTQYGYDGDGHLTTITWHDGATTITNSYSYNAAGLPTTMVNELGQSTTLDYDSARRVTTITRAVDSAVQKYAYDANGNLGTMVDARGNTFTYANDALGRVTGWIDGEGKRGTLAYNARGNVTQSIDPLGVQTDTTYDSRGDRKRSVQADGTPLARVTELNTYDLLGRPASSRDARGNTTEYNFDALGQLVSASDANQGSSRNVFDWAGQLKESIDALGFGAKNTYNTRGMPVTMTNAAGDSSTMAYDAAMNLTTFTNARGKSWLTAYDDLGRPVTSTDPNGNKTTTTYDNAGNVVLVTDPYGKKTTITFDFVGRTVAVTDRNIHKSTTTYDINYNAVLFTSARGFSATTVYDKNNRVKATTDFNNKATTLTRDNIGSVLTSVNPLGNTFTYSRDALGRATSLTNAENESSTQGLDAGDLPVLSIDAKGNATQMSYDALGRLVTVRDAQGNITKNTYDANSNLIAATDANGNATQYVYDKLNRVIKTTDAAGNTTQSSFDAAGNLTAWTDGNNQTTTYDYDDGNRRINMQTPAGTTVYTYDNNNLLLTVTDRNSNKTTYTYNDGGLLTKITNPDNTSVIYDYDDNDNRKLVIDPNGNRTTFTFNNNNLVSSTLDALNKTTTYEYDKASRNTAIVDRLGRRREFVYDNADRLTNEIWKTNSVAIATIAFAYDDAGNLTSAQKLDQAGTYLYTLAYDSLNQTESVAAPFRKTLTFGYDAAGNRTSVEDSDNGTVTSTYNSLNLLSGRTLDDGSTWARVNLTYTNRNQLAGVTRVDGGGTVGSTSYTYDNAMRLSTINHKNAGGTSLASYQYSYDPGSRLTTMVMGGATTVYTYTYANQLSDDGTTTWTYDAAGNRNNHGATPTTGNRYTSDGVWSYTYNAEGNVTQKAKSGESWFYSYDFRNQIQLAQRTTSGVLDLRVEYKYDAFGNRVETISGTPLDQYADSVVAVSTQEGSSSAQALDFPDIFDYNDYAPALAWTAGTPTSNDSITLGLATAVYASGVTVRETFGNGFVKQIDVRDAGGNYHTVWMGADSSAPNVVANFNVKFPATTYLVNAVRIWVDSTHGSDQAQIDAVNVQGYASEPDRQRYAYDGWNPAKACGMGNERFDIWADLDNNNDITTRYLDGDGIDQKLARIEANEDERWLLTDYLGTVRHLQDETGALVNTMTYDTWGKLVSETGAGDDALGRYAWTGRERDVGTGMQYNRARYYDPIAGRWLTQDPLGFEAGDSNFYRYVRNEPTGQVDPAGQNNTPAPPQVRPQVTPELLNGAPAILHRDNPIGGGLHTGRGGAVLDPQVLNRREDINSFYELGMSLGYSKAYLSQLLNQALQGLTYDDVTLNIREARRRLWQERQQNCPAPATLPGGNGLIPPNRPSTLIPGGPEDPFSSGVWSLPPFERGRVIERHLGQNLPQNFPTIDRFENGVATSIKSMDLAAPTYASAANIVRTGRAYVDAVANFNGRNWAGVNIRPGDITARGLDLAIRPGGMTSEQLQALQDVVAYGAQNGVTVNIVMVP